MITSSFTLVRNFLFGPECSKEKKKSYNLKYFTVWCDTHAKKL